MRKLLKTVSTVFMMGLFLVSCDSNFSEDVSTYEKFGTEDDEPSEDKDRNAIVNDSIAKPLNPYLD